MNFGQVGVEDGIFRRSRDFELRQPASAATEGHAVCLRCIVEAAVQLHSVLDDLSGFSTWTLLGYSAIVVGAVALTRIVWVFAVLYLPKIRRYRRDGLQLPSPRAALLVGWSGMRGAVSLAAALAIPLTVDGGGPFPGRPLIVFLTFAVILATLLGQGLTLPWLVVKLGDYQSLAPPGGGRHDVVTN